MTHLIPSIRRIRHLAWLLCVCVCTMLINVKKIAVAYGKPERAAKGEVRGRDHTFRRNVVCAFVVVLRVQTR
jgi:hypothetical protein